MLWLCLKGKRPGPRLLEPVGTICHLTWQTKPWLISLVIDRGAGGERESRVGGGDERSKESSTVSSLLPHRVPQLSDPDWKITMKASSHRPGTTGWIASLWSELRLRYLRAEGGRSHRSLEIAIWEGQGGARSQWEAQHCQGLKSRAIHTIVS